MLGLVLKQEPSPSCITMYFFSLCRELLSDYLAFPVPGAEGTGCRQRGFMATVELFSTSTEAAAHLHLQT